MRALLPLALLTACAGDETISGYLDREASWQLAELNGAGFTATATLRFPEEGQVAGNGPCNAFSATQSAPYPWFAIGPIAATRRACPELEAEAQFFEALASMSIAEVSGDVLVLSRDDSTEMVFQKR